MMMMTTTIHSALIIVENEESKGLTDMQQPFAIPLFLEVTI